MQFVTLNHVVRMKSIIVSKKWKEKQKQQQKSHNIFMDNNLK